MMGSLDSRWFKKGRVEMNGAESLVRTLAGAGVETCFMNPGTSEIHFVQTLDRVREMRRAGFCSKAWHPALPTATRG